MRLLAERCLMKRELFVSPWNAQLYIYFFCIFIVFYMLKTLAGSSSTGCTIRILYWSSGLCIPSVLSNNILSVIVHRERSEHRVSGPVLAQSTEVPSFTDFEMRETDGVPTENKLACIQPRGPASLVCKRVAHSGRLEIIRRGFRGEGF